MDPLTPSPASSTRLAQYLGVLGVGLIIGAVIGAFATPYLPLNNTDNTDNTYQAGFDAAKKIIENNLGSVAKTPEDFRTVSGTVSAVSGSGFTLHVQSLDPFADPALASRTVLVDSSTTVIKLVPKDSKTLQSEMDAFVKATQAGGGVSKIIPPTPVTDSPVSVSDIAVGDFVTVIAAENISSLREFSAIQVRVQTQVSTTTSAK